MAVNDQHPEFRRAENEKGDDVLLDRITVLIIRPSREMSVLRIWTRVAAEGKE